MLKRAQMNEVPRTERWSLNAVWDIEQRRVEKFVDDEANSAYGRFPFEVDRAKDLAPDVWQKIANVFPYDERVDADLLQSARDGVLEREAGSKALLLIVRLLLALAMGVEIAIFVAMWALGDADWPVIVQGVVLAVGSWSLGWGLFSMTVSLDHPDQARGRRLLTWAALTFGGLAVVVITAMRARLSHEQSFAVVAITLTLALLIALLETLNEWMTHRYASRHRDMFRAQRQYASEQHNVHHREKGEKWMNQFRYAVDRRATSTPKILHPNNAPGAPDEFSPSTDAAQRAASE